MRGGQRNGSGRKKGEGSKVVRVPIGCLDLVNAIIAKHRGDDDKYLKLGAEHIKKRESAQITKKRLETLELKKLGPYIEEFEKLPRKERRMLIKKYKTPSGVAKYLRDSEEGK